LRVETHHPVVVQLEVDVVVPHAQATRLKTRAAARSPVVVPEQRAVPRINRVDVVGSRGVDDVVNEQDAAAETRGVAAVRVAISQPADDDWRCWSAATAASTASTTKPAAPRPCLRRSRRAATRREAGHPLEAEVLDRVRVDQLQRAEALAAQITGVTRPLIRQGFHDLGGVETTILARLGLTVEERGSNEQRCKNHQFFHGSRLYLIVHKYAVMSCIF